MASKKTYPLGLSMDERHVYHLNDGATITPLPGATTIIHTAWNKSDALVGWAKRVVADNAVNQYEALGRVIDSLGPEGAKRWLKSQPDQERDRAASLGTRVHFIAEQIAKDSEYLVAPDEAPFVMSYLDWYDNDRKDLEIFATETKVWNTSNPAFAGTSDVWLRRADGTYLIADYKTGKNVYPHEVLMQLGAYTLARQWELDALKPNPWGALVLHIRPEGVTPHEYTPAQLEQGIAAFVAACDIYAWSKEKFVNG